MSGITKPVPSGEELTNMIIENNILIKSMLAQNELNGRRYLNLKEAAEFLRRTPRQVKAFVESKRIIPCRPDRKLSFDIVDLVAFMDKNKIR